MQTDPSKLPEVQQATATADKLVALAGSYHVTTAAEYGSAGGDLVQVNTAIARLEELRLSMTRPIDQGLRAIREFFRGPTERLERAKSQIKRAMIAYDEEQQRIAREAQRRAEEQARLAREEQERKARELEQRAAAERAAGNARAAARLETRAEVAQDRAASVVAPTFVAETPKVKGVSGRRVWKYRVKDANLVPREYLMLDDKKIGAVVRAMRKDTNIAGIEVYDEPDLSASRGAA